MVHYHWVKVQSDSDNLIYILWILAQYPNDVHAKKPLLSVEQWPLCISLIRNKTEYSEKGVRCEPHAFLPSTILN